MRRQGIYRHDRIVLESRKSLRPLDISASERNVACSECDKPGASLGHRREGRSGAPHPLPRIPHWGKRRVVRGARLGSLTTFWLRWACSGAFPGCSPRPPLPRAVRERERGEFDHGPVGAAFVQVKPRAGRDSGPSRGFPPVPAAGSPVLDCTGATWRSGFARYEQWVADPSVAAMRGVRASMPGPLHRDNIARFGRCGVRRGFVRDRSRPIGVQNPVYFGWWRVAERCTVADRALVCPTRSNPGPARCLRAARRAVILEAGP
jgi:hypothetical protein